jgi:hypothetical protein
VCDIADADRATSEYFELVRPNRGDQYKEADAGTFWANLKAAMDLLSDDQKLAVLENEKIWAEWASATVGLSKSNVGRYYSLIKYEKVAELVDRWVLHAFGRETFVISHWSNMQSQRMMGVSSP